MGPGPTWTNGRLTGFCREPRSNCPSRTRYSGETLSPVSSWSQSMVADDVKLDDMALNGDAVASKDILDAGGRAPAHLPFVLDVH